MLDQTWRYTMTASALAGMSLAVPATAQSSTAKETFGSDIASFADVRDARADYVIRDMMIPMRDGVRLRTLIAFKKGTKDAPILMERTPYGADNMAFARSGEKLAKRVRPAIAPFVEDGYVLVWQDIRGRGGSDGVYVLNRPLVGPLNTTGLDHATDSYDTIEWLVKNTAETNGRVALIGGSYNGYLALMASASGHPALKAVVPVNPMVDTWMGDDWFHNGAFRQVMLGVIPYLLSNKGLSPAIPPSGVDLYARYLEAGSAGAMIDQYELTRFPWVQRLLAHPAYDNYWREQALDTVLARHPIKVPMLLVGGVWDEQDQYGAAAMFRKLHPLDRSGKISLLLGPWSHMGVFNEGAALGAIRFDDATGIRAREQFIKPFLDAHLKSSAPRFKLAPITSYATGENRWRSSADFALADTPLFLHSESKLDWTTPTSGEAATSSYRSDPARPVPVVNQPFHFSGSDAWATSLVADQRFAAQRPDVLTFVSEPLREPVHIFGQPRADLFAATTGTDSDWIVKLVDVYPDEASESAMNGYQLPVSMDIFRGRYVDGFDAPRALTAGKAERYQFALPAVDHVFLKGHRIMVQVQSSWFPIYDRNPQTFITTIFRAKPGDFVAATQSVYHDADNRSAVWLPVLKDGMRKRGN